MLGPSQCFWKTKMTKENGLLFAPRGHEVVNDIFVQCNAGRMWEKCMFIQQREMLSWWGFLMLAWCAVAHHANNGILHLDRIFPIGSLMFESVIDFAAASALVERIESRRTIGNSRWIVSALFEFPPHAVAGHHSLILNISQSTQIWGESH